MASDLKRADNSIALFNNTGICSVFSELFRSCSIGDLPKVQELIEEASTTTINKLYQGGSTLLYKYATIKLTPCSVHVKLCS